MVEEPRDKARPVVNLSGSAFAETSTSGTLTVIQPDEIRVRKSKELRCLRLRNGDIICRNSVEILIDGDWKELTTEDLPDAL